MDGEVLRCCVRFFKWEAEKPQIQSFLESSTGGGVINTRESAIFLLKEYEWASKVRVVW